MAVANKTYEFVGAHLIRTDSSDGRKVGFYIGLNEVTDASGDKVIAVPAGWDKIEYLEVQADTLGTVAGTTMALVNDSTWAVAFGGSDATTFHYFAIVSRLGSI